MSKIVSIHSFRGGTGKSNITANLAVLTALTGKRVGIVDTDVQSPGIHVLFGFDEDGIDKALNDYLWGRCPVEEAAYDVSAVLDQHVGERPPEAAVYLIPSSLRTGEIARVLREGYDVSRLNDGFRELQRALKLDYLFIDTHPGVNEETLLSIAISDALVIVLRADNQDYQGTAVTVDLARRLETPRIMLVVNKVLLPFRSESVKAKIGSSYQVPVAGVLPLSEDVVRLASGGVFSLVHPAHQVTNELRAIAAQLP
ncbi:MAG: MinD/ParA family protein [Deltaproteobacteria bacterium]|nr:MinD/ParA family protein [Deltaproteobacteria bacterium]